jgi:hypothetical protein
MAESFIENRDAIYTELRDGRAFPYDYVSIGDL